VFLEKRTQPVSHPEAVAGQAELANQGCRGQQACTAPGVMCVWDSPERGLHSTGREDVVCAQLSGTGS
jgi:hypothetical protein